MSRHNNYNRQSSSGTVVKVIAVVLVLLVAAYVTLSLVFASWNPALWTKRDTIETKEPSDSLINVTDTNGIKLKTSRIARREFSEYGIDEQADTAYSITATVNADAVDTSVVGSVSFANASSSWANGKNISDYAVLNQTVEFGLEFTLTIKQAFGEPLNVVIASRYDSDVNATAQVDYLKELTSFTAVLNPLLPANSLSRLYVGNTKTNTVSVTPVYGVGTVQGTISDYKTTFTVSANTKTYLDEALKKGSGTSSFFTKSTVVCSGSTFNIGFCTGTVSSRIIDGGGNTTGANTVANNYFAQYGGVDTGTGAGRAGVSSIKYEITYSYGDDYSETVSYTDSKGTAIRSDSVTLINTVTSIELDKENIVVLPG